LDQGAESIEELLRAAEVGSTIQLRIDKGRLNAEVHDRVSPIVDPSPDPGGRVILEGFTKDARGMWDLERVTRARGSDLVEIVIRRAASDI